jgi:hypothetical protein
MHAPHASRRAAPPPPPGAHQVPTGIDPLRFCVFTTVALLAWLLGAPAVVMAMSAMGLWTYGRAVRGGLTQTRCVLRHPKLVLAYLALAFLAAAAAVTGAVLGRFA